MQATNGLDYLMNQVLNPAPVSFSENISEVSCLDEIEKCKKILAKLYRSTFTSEEELLVLRKNTEILRRAFRQSRIEGLKPAFTALNHFVCALRGRFVSPEVPLIGLFETDDKGPHTHPKFKPQVVAMPMPFAKKGISAWITLAHVVGHDILESDCPFENQTLLELLRETFQEAQFDADQLEIRDHFLARLNELAADVLGIWLLGKIAGIVIMAYTCSKAPWSCVRTKERAYIISAAMECLLDEQEIAKLIKTPDQTKKIVARKLVQTMKDMLPFSVRKWSDIDDGVVRKYISAFKDAGRTQCLTDAVDWTGIDPAHKVAAAFMASFDMPKPNEEPSPDFGSIPLAQDETYVNQAIGKVTEEEYVQNIFDAMITSLQ